VGAALRGPAAGLVAYIDWRRGQLDGEFAIAGPGLLKGYYRNPELYAESVRDGYFMTGDLGSIAEDGRCYYTDRKKDLVIKGGVKLWHLNTDYYKSLLYSRIRWPQGEPGGFHLFEGADEDYCRQIVAEELVTKASGKRTWVRRSRDNHYLDCEVNAYAAAETLQVQTLKPLDPEPAKPKPGSSHNPDGFVKRPPGGFIRR